MTTDPAAAFFGELARRGHEPLLRNASGAIRFDLARGGRTERWHVTVAKGDVAVSRRNARADAVVHMDASLFDDLTRGRANATAALLRGEIAVEGDPGLLVSFQRLFPGPQS